MGYADRIGTTGPSVGDLVRARTARLIEVELYLRERGNAWLGPDELEPFSAWVERGGPRPWQDETTGGHTYPPEAPR